MTSMLRRRRKVLLLGDDTRSFLSVVRSLGRAGIDVHVAWHCADDIALKSRYIRVRHDLPPALEETRWVTALLELMRREQFDLILPCNDRTAYPLQRFRQNLEQHGRVYLLADEVFSLLTDKSRTNALARAARIPLPRERLLNPGDRFDPDALGWHYPLVLKPIESHDPTNPTGKRHVQKAYTAKQALKDYLELSRQGPVLAQENFLGDGQGVELLLRNGEPLMLFQHRRLHEPLLGGGSSYRQSVSVDPALLDASLKLLTPLRYTGVAMVEFKVDPASGDWVFIEVNPRFWGSLPLAVAAGADFPLALFQMLVEGQTNFPTKYRVGLCCRSVTADVNWHAANLRADRTDRTLQTRPLFQDLSQSIANVLTLRERFDTLTLDDTKPFVDELKQIALRFGKGMVRRVKGRVRLNRSFRVLLQRHALNDLRKAERLLFICKGNVCRSPFAERIARRHLPQTQILGSAGYLPPAGRSSPEHAQKAAHEMGVDLSAHHSRLLTRAMLDEADAVFVFDDSNYAAVMDQLGPGRKPVHFVGALDQRGPLVIKDPWGQDAGAFELCYHQIRSALNNAVDQTNCTRQPVDDNDNDGISLRTKAS